MHYTFTSNPKINSDIISGFKKSKYEIIIDRKDAIYQMMDRMDEHAILLVLGKGHENYQAIGKEKIPFSDKKTIINYTREG